MKHYFGWNVFFNANLTRKIRITIKWHAMLRLMNVKVKRGFLKNGFQIFLKITVEKLKMAVFFFFSVKTKTFAFKCEQ